MIRVLRKLTVTQIDKKFCTFYEYQNLLVLLYLQDLATLSLFSYA